jgi:hypothetical protein
MRRLLLLACCAAFVPLGFAFAEDDDPEPAPSPDGAIKKLDDAISGKKANAEAVEKERKRLVERLKKEHAGLVKRGQDKKALAMKERLLLAESLKPGQGLETKLTVPKLLEKASSNGRYRDLLHVLYVPADKASYNDFTDYGYSGTGSWGGYNNLTFGHWVYVYPRWYIWKELKP